MLNLVTKIQAASIGDDVPIFVSHRSGAQGAFDWPYYTGVVVNVLFFATALATFIYMLWAGVRILSASGEKSRMDEGKQRITFAIVGLIIVAGAYAIWNLILAAVGFNNVDTKGL
jgi:nitroreductase